MTELTKKLSMKKAFFVTQLESFFSNITTEFQEKVSSLEVENRLLKEQNEKLDYDVRNLVQIKNDLVEKLNNAQKDIENLKNELKSLKTISNDERNLELIRENNRLKKKNTTLSDEVDILKQKLANLQTYIQKGAGAYNSSILEKKKEEVIKEITKNITK